MMKRFLVLALLSLTLVTLSAQVRAEVVVVDFEEFGDQIGDNWSWNGTNDRDHSGLFPSGFGEWHHDIPGPYGTLANEIAYQSGGTTFYLQGGESYEMGYWFGTGLSTVTDTTFNSYLNEMTSVTGSGNNGSKTYAVVYGDSTINLDYDSPYNPRISLPTDAILQSIAITNTAYTYGCLIGDDPYGFTPGLAAFPNGLFDLLIYGVDGNGELVDTLRIHLGKTNSDGSVFTLTDWLTVDLSSFVDVTELRFSFDGDDVLDMGNVAWLNQPVYFAFDDLTYTIAGGEAARRIHCQNNLKQIGIAHHNYFDIYGYFTPGGYGCRGTPAEHYPDNNDPSKPGVTGKKPQEEVAWSLLLLPFIEQQSVYAQYNINLWIDHPANKNSSTNSYFDLFMPVSSQYRLSSLDGGDDCDNDQLVCNSSSN